MTAVVIVGVATWQIFHPPPGPPRLPPFSEQVYLGIEAEWADHDCVNVITTTNLPAGTVFSIIAQRAQVSGAKGSPAHGVIVSSLHRQAVESVRPRMNHGLQFCGLGSDNTRERESLLLKARVAGPYNDPSFGDKTNERWQRQARRVGERGELLRGSLAHTSKGFYPGESKTSASSKTILLEP